MTRILMTAIVASALVSATTEQFAAAASGLPARLDHYLTGIVKISPEERTRLLGGEPVSRLLEADEKKEVAVFGAVWIDAPMRRYADAVRDIERFEHGGGFKITRRISAKPQLDDFAGFRLPDEDVADLRTCRVGDCKVKLDENALARFQTEIDWTAATSRTAVDGLMRQLAVDYATEYLKGGNEALAVYRDKARPTFVAREFRGMIDGAPELSEYMPDVRRYLLDYPATPTPAPTSFLYWQETHFGLRPTLRMSHLTMWEGTNDMVVASKMLYASHYFWTALELRILLPDPSRGPGFWFITIYRGRADGLSGFTGMVVRSRVRTEAQNGARAGLTLTKRLLEGGTREPAKH